MRLATLRDGSPDGTLIVISADGERMLPAADIAPNLLALTERWSASQTALQALAARLDQGEGKGFALTDLAAPLPRSWQWLDGSAFSTHGDLMQIAFGLPPIDSERPLMYQGMSDKFYSATDDIPFPSEADGIDFEGEFGVVVDHVPLGTSAENALDHIKLLVQINDWSLRAIAPIEMKTGFGWVQAKPPCSMAPFAITPDELGDNWRDGRICVDLTTHWNGKLFGHPNGAAMDFGFHELVAHAARTRDLVAGTIIGSGTVSNPNYMEVGSACISEQRAAQMIADGSASTPFMSFGDTVTMQAAQGSGLFGMIDQKVVKA